MFVGNTYAQDTLHVNDESLDDIIKYSARDSIYTDLKKKQVHLYGDAQVENSEINLKAGYILIDLDKQEVTATHALNDLGEEVGYPVFTDGSDEIESKTIRFNFETKKAYIEGVKMQQDEYYLYMEKAKRHQNDELHFRTGKFTTCDLEEPHYHFQLSKAVMIPEKRIVSGPMNLWIVGVPTPFGLPFSVIPEQKERTHGIMFPELVPLSNYGFGVHNLGYYFPINQNLQTTAYVNLYSRGSWGVRNVTEYFKLYGYKGAFDAGFQQFRSGFPSNINQNKFSIFWQHTKDPKSSPYWGFASNVQFTSDNNNKASLDPVNPNFFKNTLTSDVNLTRSFPGLPLRMGLKLGVRQNSTSQNIALTSPIFNLNTTQFFPLKKLFRGSESWKQLFTRFGVIYGLEGQNRSTFKDSLLTQGNFNAIGSQFMNGIQQKLTVQTTGALFKNILKITPSVSYSNSINFQQGRRYYDTVAAISSFDTISQTGTLHNLSIGASATTNLYSYYKFIGPKKALLRHIATPSISFSYIPFLNPTITDTIIPGQNPVTYSPFERSLYTGSLGKDQGLISFGINNTFELKRASNKDTLTGFSKTRIIDALSITGNYDLFKDSMNLSPLTINLRISPVNWFNFIFSSNYSTYGWDDSTGVEINSWALQSNNRLGRFTNASLNSTFIITSKEGHKQLEETEDLQSNVWTADFDYYALHPEFLIDFRIPWKITFTHILNYSLNQNKLLPNDRSYKAVQTVSTNGDISFTKRWKLNGTINTDLETIKVTNAFFGLSRDMHCWALSFNWTPIGTNKSFLLSIRNTSALFGDAKLNFRRPPVFL